MPKIFGGKSTEEIQKAVLELNHMARLLKNKRIQNGALRLDSPKLKFKLTEDTGLPYGITLEEVMYIFLIKKHFFSVLMLIF